MTIDYLKLKSRAFPPVRQSVDERDAILYALSMGLGQDPVDAAALSYLYEGALGGIKVLPTFAVVLGGTHFWQKEPEAGIDWVKLVHGEQRMVVHRPIPSQGWVVGHNRITHVIDKGAGKGAIVITERQLRLEGGELLATISQVVFCRGDGGYSLALGGQPSDEPLPALPQVPGQRPCDWIDDQRIRPDAALLYRLLSDRNPLHADPQVAAAAGFERPILHGLATYGMACNALLRCSVGNGSSTLRSLDVRFAAPVFPGETMRTEIWRDGNTIQFQARALERNVVVLSHGRAIFR